MVVQWLRIYLVMQSTWVRSLVQELRSTCSRATKPRVLCAAIEDPHNTINIPYAATIIQLSQIKKY